MNEKGIREVLRQLGCPSIRLCGDHVRANCPLAPYTHKKGTDRHPSFLVKIEDFDKSCYHCFSCGNRGTLNGLLYELQQMGMHIDPELVERVRRAERQDPVAKAYQRASIFSKEFLVLDRKYKEEIWSEEEYKPYAGKTHKYILDRGVSLDACQTWELGYDPEKRRVMFPVRRYPDLALVGAVGRTVEKGVEPTYLTYFNFKKSNFLYGEHRLKRASEAVIGEALGYDLPAQDGVIVVEGMMDVLKLCGIGYENVVGLMTATISKRQVSTLKKTGRDIYMMLDWDRAGMSGRRTVAKAFAEKCRVYDVPGFRRCSCGSRWSMLDGDDEQVCRECKAPWTDYSGEDKRFKDPDGLTEEELLDCLGSAKIVRISS